MLKVTPNNEGFKRLRSMGEALRISEGDWGGPILRVMDGVHRKQMRAAFVSEGASTGSRWARLNPRYEARKRRAFPGKKILRLRGETMARFVRASHPAHFARHFGRGKFGFGAYSDIAAAHLYGNPALSPPQSAAARKVFGGTASRLPVRNMIAKTAANVREFNQALVVWYRKRVQQVLRAHGRLMAATRPR